MKIVIAGASGLVGSALAPALRSAGHDVRRLVRGRRGQGPGEISWNPAAKTLDLTELGEVNAFINLAGENVGDGRWTAARREAILRSRIDPTQTLLTAIAKMARKPEVLVNASAIGFYGDRGDEVLTESAGRGSGFLPDVCRAWEECAAGAAQWGVRTVLARFGVVLAPKGGALGKMLPLFRCGLGGRMGSGRQWLSWVSIDDVVGALVHAVGDGRCVGPLNVVAPTPVTNADFAQTLGRVLHRPTLLPAPAWALRMAVGAGMADEALLASQRASPEGLRAAGYVFRQPALEGALRSVLAQA